MDKKDKDIKTDISVLKFVFAMMFVWITILTAQVIEYRHESNTKTDKIVLFLNEKKMLQHRCATISNKYYDKQLTYVDLDDNLMAHCHIGIYDNAIVGSFTELREKGEKLLYNKLLKKHQLDKALEE